MFYVVYFVNIYNIGIIYYVAKLLLFLILLYKCFIIGHPNKPSILLLLLLLLLLFSIIILS